MGCGRHCLNTFEWSITNRHRPPVGGWSIEKIPGSHHLNSAWANRPKRWPCQNPAEAVQEMAQFLLANRSSIPMLDIQREADRQYCEKTPGRCPPKKKTPMAWATPFWGRVNRSLSDMNGDGAAIVEGWTAEAKRWLSGVDGCKSCLTHFLSLLGKNQATIRNMEDARIWTWAIHNSTREGKEPRAYAEIAEEFNWPPQNEDAIQSFMANYIP